MNDVRGFDSCDPPDIIFPQADSPPLTQVLSRKWKRQDESADRKKKFDAKMAGAKNVIYDVSVDRAP